MLRKLLMPVVTGFVIGKAIQLYTEHSHKKHPIKRLIFGR